jgi:ABC-2 type transport system permease protein
MRSIFLVAKREYLEQIRGRAFRVSTVLVPLLFAVIIVVAYLSGRGSGVGKHVIVAAPSRSLAEAIRSQILNDKDAKTSVDVAAPAARQDRPALVNEVISKQVDGLLWVDAAPNGATSAT